MLVQLPTHHCLRLQSGKRRIHFRLYVNFRSHLFASAVPNVYLHACRIYEGFLVVDHYIRIQIVNNGITKWLLGHSGLFAFPPKNMTDGIKVLNACTFTIFSLQTHSDSLSSLSQHSMDIKSWKKRKNDGRMVKGKNQKAKWNARYNQSPIHVQRIKLHLIARQKSISNTGKSKQTSITFGQAHSPKLENRIFRAYLRLQNGFVHFFSFVWSCCQFHVVLLIFWLFVVKYRKFELVTILCVCVLW